MSETILCITCNPAIDITYRIDSLRPHHVHRVQKVYRRAGGKGVNVASVLAQMGDRPAVSGFIGGRSGEEFLSLLDEGLSSQWIEVESPTRATTAIVDDSDVTLFNEPGGFVSEEAWKRLAEKIISLAPRLVAICGSFPTGTKTQDLVSLIKAAHAVNAICIVDTSGEYLMEAARAQADLVKPNREELCAATGCIEINEGVEAVLSAGAQAVLVSDSSRGMGLFSANERTRYWWGSMPYALTGNATGAGDSSVAAIAHHIASYGMDRWDEGLRQAVALSAATVVSPVAGRYDEVKAQQYRKEVKIDVMCRSFERS